MDIKLITLMNDMKKNCTVNQFELKGSTPDKHGKKYIWQRHNWFWFTSDRLRITDPCKEIFWEKHAEMHISLAWLTSDAVNEEMYYDTKYDLSRVSIGDFTFSFDWHNVIWNYEYMKFVYLNCGMKK